MGSLSRPDSVRPSRPAAHLCDGFLNEAYRALSSESVQESGPDLLTGLTDRLIRQVSIALGGQNLRVAQQLPITARFRPR